jgi:hypothetical protein
MNWTTLIPIIAQYGIPIAQKLWQKATSGTQVTQADWDELMAMTRETAKDRLIAQLNAAGIPLTDPKAVALLALVS